jgi:hypothetical protein
MHAEELNSDILAFIRPDHEAAFRRASRISLDIAHVRAQGRDYFAGMRWVGRAPSHLPAS